MIRTYEINTSDEKSVLEFAIKHNNCAVIFKKMDLKNKDFIVVAEEV